jgi:hypothetical protein
VISQAFFERSDRVFPVPVAQRNPKNDRMAMMMTIAPTI